MRFNRLSAKLLLIKGVKSPRKLKVFFSANFTLLAEFFGSGATIHIGQEMLFLPNAGYFFFIFKEQFFFFFKNFNFFKKKIIFSLVFFQRFFFVFQ